MAVETSAVQITINVVDGNSGAAVGQVTKNIEGMGMAGATSGAKVAKGMDAAGVGALSAVERMRLVTEEAGVRMPRALIRLAAESKLASAAVNAIGTGLVAIGAIQIGAMVLGQLYEGAKKIYEKWLDVDGAIRRYNDGAAEAAQKKFDENRSLQQVNEDLRTANQLIDQLNQKKEIATNKNVSWGQFGTMLGASLKSIATGAPYDYHFSVADAGKLNAAHGQSDHDQEVQEKKRHEEAVGEMRDKAIIAEAGMTGIAKERAARNAAYGEAKEQTQSKINMQNQLAAISERAGKKPGDVGYVPRADQNTFLDEENAAKAHADAEFQAHSIGIGRQNAQELARLREQALEADLRGISLLEAQRKAAYANWASEHGASRTAMEKIDEKYYADEKKLRDDQIRETEKIERQASLAGKTGIAKTQGEGANRVADLVVDKSLDPENRARRILAANRETDAQISEEKRSLADYVNQLSDQSTAHQISGFARINAEASKQIDELHRKIEAGYGKMPKIGPASADQTEGAHLIQVGTAGINQNAADQRAELRQRDADETAQVELEAQSKSLSAEKQQTFAIESEYEQRTHKYKEELDAQIAGGKLAQEDLLALNDDYNRRVVAAGELRDAQMVEASKAAREKMAGEFTSLFKSLDHPMEALKGLGEKAAGEAAAAMVQRMQTHFGGGGAAATAPTGQGLMESLMGRIAGHPGAPGAHGGPAHAGTSELASVKAISLGTAEIHIQSASVAFGGSMAAGSSSRTPGALGAAGSVPGIAGGSTELLTMPGSAFNAPSSAESSTSAPQGFGGGYSSSGSTTGGAGAVIGDIQQGMGLFKPETQNATVPGQFDKNGNFVSGGSTNNGGGMLGALKQGWGLVKQGASIFGGGKTGTGSDGGYAETQNASVPGQFDKNGDFVPGGGTGTGGMLGGGGVGANAMGAAGGAMGIFSAYEGNGGVGGAASGAMSGMQLGMALGGPLGAGIGAAAGAVIGAIGPGGREKARVYDLKQVRPRIGDDIDGFQHAGDYLTAYADVQSLDQDAKKATNAMGPSAQAYYQDTIKKEIKLAEGKLTSEQKAGRSQEGVTTPQYDWGGPVDNFGTFGDGPTHGMIRAQRGEYVVEQQAANTHAGALNAINSGATPSDMAKYYGGGSDTIATAPSSRDELHLHVHTMDVKGVKQFLSSYKHDIRSAVAQSFAENSGAADIY